MSTEHQRYSTQNQSDAIALYAEQRGIEIVRTYSDAGKSGLRIQGRDGLQQLLEDIQAGNASYEAILVYDVSRWGRFQDADESAYYEYICKRAGISIIYCAEQFENDGSPVSTIVKGVKRAMAGEYSRELSQKVFSGQCRLVELGFRQGGPPGFGLRRMLIDETGKPKGVLKRGEHKSIQTDRVTLVPGPQDEIEIVRGIFEAFVEDKKSETDIAEKLNSRGIATDLGRGWTRGTVHQILINEKYVGNNVWNRSSFKLKKRRVRNEPESWIRAVGAFEAIVDKTLFSAANAIIDARSSRVSDDEMLDVLREILQTHGFLSGLVIDEADTLLSSSAYRSRFGGLLRAYRLVGFKPDRDYRYIKINRQLRALHPDVVSHAVSGIEAAGGVVARDEQTDLLIINDEFRASIVVVRCVETSAGSLRWNIRFDIGLRPDITIAVRMDRLNRDPLDYYLLPSIDMNLPRLRLAEYNGLSLDAYRCDTLAWAVRNGRAGSCSGGRVMEPGQSGIAEMIRIERITVVNPRDRNQRSFKEIVDSIAELGLKRPITVAKRDGEDDPKYDLVCGQGRLEAFKELGQTEIPAIIVSASSEDCLVMSLVENLARRQHRALDLLRDIRGLKERGYSDPDIARKTNLSIKYVRGVGRLLMSAEHRLLRAVESGKIPISVAVDIAEADDTTVQDILRQAYEDNLLRGGRLMAAKRLVEARIRHGKGQPTLDRGSSRSLSVGNLVRTYQIDVDKKQALLRKATATRNELMFITETLRKLFNDENFVTLLRAEGLATIPKNLMQRLETGMREI